MPPNGKGGKTRRDFCKSAAAAAMGGVAAAVPGGAALRAILAPAVAGTPEGAPFVRVAPLDAVPKDGTPAQFPVVADRIDAWTRDRDVPIGAVYLRRAGSGQIEALNAVCPHAGGLIDYTGSCFLCPLHKSRFNADGSVQDPRSPSPRAMDTLETEIRDGAVWVRFENFRAGTAEKIPA